MTEFLPENSDRNIKLRQYRDALAISGRVVIAFSLWDMLKVLVGFFLGEETIFEIVSTSIGKEQAKEHGDSEDHGVGQPAVRSSDMQERDTEAIMAAAVLNIHDDRR